MLLICSSNKTLFIYIQPTTPTPRSLQPKLILPTPITKFSTSLLHLQVTSLLDNHTGIQLMDIKSLIIRLYIDPSKFQNMDSVPFNMTDSMHLYTMDDCDCSSHGTCDTSQHTLHCLCSTGYAGTQCSSCAAGYHYAGT
jgi:hypothetical protein